MKSVSKLWNTPDCAREMSQKFYTKLLKYLHSSLRISHPLAGRRLLQELLSLLSSGKRGNFSSVLLQSKPFSPGKFACDQHCWKHWVSGSALMFEVFCGKYKVIELESRPDGSAIQQYLAELTGARTVPRVFIGGILNPAKDFAILHPLRVAWILRLLQNNKTLPCNPFCEMNCFHHPIIITFLLQNVSAEHACFGTSVWYQLNLTGTCIGGGSETAQLRRSGQLRKMLDKVGLMPMSA